MLPPPAQFAEAVGRYGVRDDSRVVLYDACVDGWAHMWAARVWWMLRVYGFENVSVLNGGLYKWKLEGRPFSTEPSSYPPGTFTPRYRPELVASKDEVLAAVGSQGTAIVNALPAEAHSGAASMYARPGRIASSVNVPTMSLIDPDTHAYLPPEQLREQFAKARALDRERVVTYCGAGIAASSDALILSMLGAPNVAVYDGSLAEWTADPSLPMETD
jgi:thiosulfate/3-mercaptopyruvate sulfurtransferase